MTARTLMNENLVALKPTDSVITAAEIILKHHLRHLPVVDEQGCYLGTFGIYSVLQLALPSAVLKQGLENIAFVTETSHDLAQRLNQRHDEPVRNWLTQDPVVYPNTPAMKVLQLILKGHTSVPVVNRETERLEGIISSWNVLEILMRERA
ncbi:MAG: CBS domain-containing protein [Candidatus Competibacteraceae bacterium]